MLIENRVHLVADRHAHLMFLGELEDEFGGSITDNDAKSLATVGDVISYISRRVEEKALA